MPLTLNATSFENGFSAAKELVCSAVDEGSYACETWIAHKSSVFSTSGYCWFYAGLQIVVGFIFFTTSIVIYNEEILVFIFLFY